MIDPGGKWQQDAEGNWIAEKGDNAYSLAKALKINPSEAIGLLKEQGYEFSEGDKKVFLNIGDKVSPKKSSSKNYDIQNFINNYPESGALEDATFLDPIFAGFQYITSNILQFFGMEEQTSESVSTAIVIGASFIKITPKVTSLGSARSKYRSLLKNVENLDRKTLIRDIESAGFKKVYD